MRRHGTCAGRPSNGSGGSTYARDRARQRRHRRGLGLLSGGCGARGRRPRPAGGAGARDQLCQCRRGLARLCLALGGAGHSAQGAEVAVHAPPPAVHLAKARPGPDPLGPAHAHELHRRPLRDQQGPDGAAGRVQPRPVARPARQGRYRLRRAQPGYLAAVPYPEDARRHRQGRGDPAEIRRALRAARRGGLRPGRAGAGPGSGEDRGRAAAARRRDRRLLHVHQRPGRGLPPAGCRVPQRHPDRRPPDRGRQDHRRRH